MRSSGTSNRSTPPSTPPPRADAFDDLGEKWGARYPAVIRLWDNAWAEFIPFLDYDVEIRTVICSTDEIVKPVAGLFRLPVGDENFVGVLGLLDGEFLLVASLLVVIGRAGQAVVPAP